VSARAPKKKDPAPAAAGLGERFTVVVLAAIAAALGAVRLYVLPKQRTPEPLAFAFENPMLDAQDGERVLYHTRDNPTIQSCSVVRENGLVLRPNRGVDQIGRLTGLRRALPYLACSVHEVRRGRAACGGPASDTVLYALNFFGMPHDTKVRVDSIRPRWMKWGERELAVYEVVFERFGTYEGRWTTYLTPEAPVAGLVKWTSLLPRHTEVIFREAIETAR
jgi:hypothetical protein